MIATLLGIIAWLLRLASTMLLIYCIMSFVMPGSDLMRKAASYVEPVLHPSGSCSTAIFPGFGHFPWTCPRWLYGWCRCGHVCF